MKKLIIFAYFFLMAGVSASAQDVLITKDGDVKNVYEVEVGTNAVFYKSEDKADAAILRINKTDVYMIKRKDGTKYDLGNAIIKPPLLQMLQFRQIHKSVMPT